MIRPPPGPFPGSPRLEERRVPGVSFGVDVGMEKPEEPAKYIYELPKLQAPELATAAMCCGNWLAQVRQIMVGLSPSASV